MFDLCVTRLRAKKTFDPMPENLSADASREAVSATLGTAKIDNSMFDHVGFLVRDSKVSLPFFTACLAELGVERVQDMPEFDAALFKAPGQRAFLFIAGAGKGVPSYWLPAHRAGAAPVHLAFAAPSSGSVDAFFRAALANGGRDNGKPGFRDQGRRRNANYVAFVLDPDNNNIEASWAASSD
jgi:catechol 2,3-dioxygenase-like lactoylglutathione lyase family enzyme